MSFAARRARGALVSTAAVLAFAGAAVAVPGSGVARPALRHVVAPPTARTGGFGENTCLECHLEYAPDLPGGRLLLLGVPDAVTPGGTYTLTIRLESEEMGRAGFQVAARYGSGKRAGAFRPLDGRTTVTADSVSSIPYAHHTRTGTDVADQAVASWSMEWTAPAEPGDIVFHAAANSANGDDSPLGDFVYTAVLRTTAGGS